MDRHLGGWPTGPIADDWRGQLLHPRPGRPPGRCRRAGLRRAARRPSGRGPGCRRPAQVRWTFTANGRVDTAPTIHRGLCLFGSKSGWVYCLRADDGGLVWRLRAAPPEERIVAYGQIESPWPVPGSVLVVEDAAYFAAGRQPLADGGILVFAVEPADRPRALGRSGSTRCRRRTSTRPAAWSSTTSTCCTRKATRWPCRVGCSTAPPAR